MNEGPNESKRAQVSNLCPELQFDEEGVTSLFATLDTFGGFDAPSGGLSIAFVPKTEIARIHLQFMKIDAATDVITFPGDSDEELAGEICVCPSIANEYCSQNRADFSEELTLYLVHGYLHLCGFDDIDESNRHDMREAERIAMHTLSRHGAIPRFLYEPENSDG